MQTHPSRLAVAARLHGLDPAPVEHCRVLEIGTAVGANIIPMAETLPRSEFVGIDRSAREIVSAREGLAATGIANVRFECMDLRDLDDTFGKFDYIIAHGIYSWIPFDVRERLMQVCKERLAPKGVCYVSYNTYPGWYRLRAIREALLYRMRDAVGSQEKLECAFRFLDLITTLGENGGGHDLSSLDWFQARLQESSSLGGASAFAFLFHDELAEINEPVYFHEFVEHAERHGLQYLCEATLSAPPSSVPGDRLQEIDSFSRDHIDAEQYLDHALNRMFRMSLLCHEEDEIPRPVRPRSGLLVGLGVNTRCARLPTRIGDEERGIVRYGLPDGAEIASNHPVSIAAFENLSRFSPKIVPFTELLEEARVRAGAVDSADDRETDEIALTANLLLASARRKDLATLWAYAPPVAMGAGERPRALPYARFAASSGERNITTLRHERAEIPALGMAMLPSMDGAHDRPALLAVLEGFVRDGALSPPDAVPEGETPPSLARLLDELLDTLAGFGLLALDESQPSTPVLRA